MSCALKFCYLRAPKRGKLIKQFYKEKYFAGSTIFRSVGYYKKECLSAELDPKPRRLVIIVNNENFNIFGEILQENRQT